MVLNRKESLAMKARQFLESDSATATASKIILATAAIGGLVFIGAVAPNLVQLLKPFIRSRKYSSKRFQNAYHYLRQKGLIIVGTNSQGKMVVRLTKKGEQKLSDLDLDNLVIPKPSRWDKKWRVLIFDLPVRFCRAREAFRWKVKDLGFIQLQKSVWVYPYPCDEELIFLAEFFGVTKYVEVLTVEKFFRAEELKRRFSLS